MHKVFHDETKKLQIIWKIIFNEKILRPIISKIFYSARKKNNLNMKHTCTYMID